MLRCSMTPRRRIVFIVIGLLLAGSAVFAFRRNAGMETTESVQVRRGTVESSVEFSGRVHARQESTLSFPIGGVLRQLLADTGTPVRRGQLLATLDTNVLSAEYAQAHAEHARSEEAARIVRENAHTSLTLSLREQDALLEKRRQAVRDAKNELDQAREIWQQGVRENGEDASATRTKYLAILTAESAYHAAQTALREAMTTRTKLAAALQGEAAAADADYRAAVQASTRDAGLSVTEAGEAIAAARLGQARLTAPFDGAVTESPIDIGTYVQPGATVLTLHTVQDLRVEADVPEVDAAHMREGQRVTFTLDVYGSETSWNGTVERLSPSAKPVEGVPTFSVSIRIDGSDERLRPGMTANVRVETEKKENVLTLPRRAATTRDGKQYVTVQKNADEQEERVIRIGLSGSDGMVEIIEGLSEGETVVIHPTN